MTPGLPISAGLDPTGADKTSADAFVGGSDPAAPASAEAAAPGLLSHAPNAEDVVLARLFADRPAGFWIDVGAGDPAIGSVTRHFAELGWRGVNVVTDAAAQARFEAARPHDTTLLAAAEGPAVRLDTIFTEHAPPAGIELLRVAVGEGDGAVLGSTGWKTVRPLLLLVQAVDAAGAPSHQGWHRRLVNARYRFALFDGINRYYVREEDADALAPLLAAPANARDNWRRADAAATKLAAVTTELAELRRAAETAGLVAEAKLAALADDKQALTAKSRREAQAAESAIREERRLQAALEASEEARAGLESQLATASERLRELEAELAEARAAPKVSGPLGWLTGSRRGPPRGPSRGG